MDEKYAIVCPDCKRHNTLNYVITEVKTYPIAAMASPTNADRGTFHYRPISSGSVEKNSRTACSSKGCLFEIAGTPISSRIVQKVEGE